MSYAPDYTPSTSFAENESNQASGRSTVRTAALDAEFANIEGTTDALNANLRLLQRDDGKVRDLLIEPYALSEQTRALMVAVNKTPRGLWAPNTMYSVGDLAARNQIAYMCLTAHNSGPTFNYGFWMAISGDGSAAASAEQAALSATDAFAAAGLAELAAALANDNAVSAVASAQAAAASELAAQNAANSIAGLSPVNLSVYMQAFLANNNQNDALLDLGAAALIDITGTGAAQGAGKVAFNRAANYVQGTLGFEAKLRAHAKSFQAKGDGINDDTAILQGALDLLSLTGGAILEADGGQYRLTSRLVIPSYVLFRGSSWLPDPSNLGHYKATALYIDWGANSNEHAVEVRYTSGIEGFTFFYPGQVPKTASTPIEYGFSISTPTTGSNHDNIHVKNITFYNSYRGLRLNNGGRWRVDGIQGNPLAMGITADNCFDVCYLANVHFWNFYTQNSALEAWTAANGTAYELRRIDQLFASKVFCWNYNIGFHCRDALWVAFTDILVDKANTPFLIEQSAQITVNGFTLICSPAVKPAIWGRFITSSARFSNGRITSASSVGAQIDDGVAYSFDNVEFACPHACVVNLSTTTEVRVSDTCTYQVPPWGRYNTMVNGERLTNPNTLVTLPTPALTGSAVAITGGYRVPLTGVATSTISWDTTAISQRNSLYVLEFDYELSAPTTTWYFKFWVGKDTGDFRQVSYEPLAPLILNTGSVLKRVRIPFFINHGRTKQIMQIFVQSTVGVGGAALDMTNIALYEQANRYTSDSQIAMFMRGGYNLDAYGMGQTLKADGAGRVVIVRPEPDIGRTGPTPNAGSWNVDEVCRLETPVANTVRSVICTTAGTYGGTPPVFKNLEMVSA